MDGECTGEMCCPVGLQPPSLKQEQTLLGVEASLLASLWCHLILIIQTDNLVAQREWDWN